MDRVREWKNKAYPTTRSCQQHCACYMDWGALQRKLSRLDAAEEFQRPTRRKVTDAGVGCEPTSAEKCSGFAKRTVNSGTDGVNEVGVAGLTLLIADVADAVVAADPTDQHLVDSGTHKDVSKIAWQ